MKPKSLTARVIEQLCASYNRRVSAGEMLRFDADTSIKQAPSLARALVLAGRKAKQTDDQILDSISKDRAKRRFDICESCKGVKTDELYVHNRCQCI